MLISKEYKLIRIDQHGLGKNFGTKALGFHYYPKNQPYDPDNTTWFSHEKIVLSLTGNARSRLYKRMEDAARIVHLKLCNIDFSDERNKLRIGNLRITCDSWQLHWTGDFYTVRDCNNMPTCGLTPQFHGYLDLDSNFCNELIEISNALCASYLHGEIESTPPGKEIL